MHRSNREYRKGKNIDDEVHNNRGRTTSIFTCYFNNSIGMLCLLDLLRSVQPVLYRKTKIIMLDIV